MKTLWRSGYKEQVRRYIKKNFGDSSGVATLFPYMESDFKWRSPDVLDTRTARKTNNEYHGLERHARQYHVTAQYLEAAEHWLIAAALRREMMATQGMNDRSHLSAVEFAVKNYRYNMALHRWQRAKRRYRAIPSPERFGLNSDMLDAKDAIAADEIKKVTGIDLE